MDCYRINEVEYLSDGSCAIGIYDAARTHITKFVLSRHCYKITWLAYFQESDLKTIWLLTKRQYTVFSLKRCAALISIQLCLSFYRIKAWAHTFKDDLESIEDECDEW